MIDYARDNWQVLLWIFFFAGASYYSLLEIVDAVKYERRIPKGSRYKLIKTEAQYDVKRLAGSAVGAVAGLVAGLVLVFMIPEDPTLRRNVFNVGMYTLAASMIIVPFSSRKAREYRRRYARNVFSRKGTDVVNLQPGEKDHDAR